MQRRAGRAHRCHAHAVSAPLVPASLPHAHGPPAHVWWSGGGVACAVHAQECRERRVLPAAAPEAYICTKPSCAWSGFLVTALRLADPFLSQGDSLRPGLVAISDSRSLAQKTTAADTESSPAACPPRVRLSAAQSHASRACSAGSGLERVRGEVRSEGAAIILLWRWVLRAAGLRPQPP
jgi:hypothetical protein